MGKPGRASFRYPPSGGGRNPRPAHRRPASARRGVLVRDGLEEAPGGIRKILARHTRTAGITASISPRKLETYSRLAVADAQQQRHHDAIGNFPV